GRTTEELTAQILVHEANDMHAKGFHDSRFPSEVPGLCLSGFVLAGQKSAEGVLIQSVSNVWFEVLKLLRGNWSRAYEIPSEKWEELIAGAYLQAGFDEVTLTPRSGDHGRDVIAVRRGIGCVKIIGSMKAYKPGRL